LASLVHRPATARCLKTRQAYRRAVDERLFQLGARRYDALLDTLIQLRQPQLSRRPDEARLVRRVDRIAAATAERDCWPTWPTP
jgi:hypothetical protein